MDRIRELVEQLSSKTNAVAYEALKELLSLSEESDGVYPYLDRFFAMLDSAHSYRRTRGLALLAANAKWDQEDRIGKEEIRRYLSHIVDPKPVTARQCVKGLPVIAASKPAYREAIAAALKNADLSIYADSMRPLLCRDIQDALEKLEQGT